MHDATGSALYNKPMLRKHFTAPLLVANVKSYTKNVPYVDLVFKVKSDSIPWKQLSGKIPSKDERATGYMISHNPPWNAEKRALA